jgi:hypothetical protein
MTAGTRTLKILSGVGAVAVCGASGVLVTIDPKPGTAPLRPPLSGSSPHAAALVIPPSCGGAGVTSGSASALDPSLIPVLQQLRQATTASMRRSILASLTAPQRLEVEAYVHSLRRTATGSTGGCAGSGASTNAAGLIVPSVVDAPPSAGPLINTYVS